MATRIRTASRFLLGFCALAGCTSLRRVQPAVFIPQKAPEVVWVTYPDKTVVAVTQPEIAGDTLRGTRLGRLEPVAIPLHEVVSVRAKTPDHTKTAFFITALFVGAASSVYLIWIRQAGPTPGGVQCGYDVRGQPLPYC